MEPSELIGFLISIIAFGVLMFNMAREERSRKLDPKSYEEKRRKKEDLLNRVFQDVKDADEELEDDEEDQEAVEALPPRVFPPRLPEAARQDSYQPPAYLKRKDSSIDYYPTGSDKKGILPTKYAAASVPKEITPASYLAMPHRGVSEHYLRMDSYHHIEAAGPSKLARMVGELSSKKNLLIFHEILRKPPSLR